MMILFQKGYCMRGKVYFCPPPRPPQIIKVIEL